MARARSSTAPAVNTRTTRHDDVQCMGQRDWTLFGTAGSSLSEFAADQQGMILKTIAEREDDGRSIEDRLDEAYSTLKWWKLVGCEFCFLMGG
ncbi:hypothetical protein E5D57_013255 [Metarhizium anisopliae]|nr:hypothetical protein E5D57_013255 [Metarhizium anisopliae]